MVPTHEVISAKRLSNGTVDVKTRPSTELEDARVAKVIEKGTVVVEDVEEGNEAIQEE